MADELKIKVGADTREFEAGMKRAQKQVMTLAKAQGALSKAFLEGKVSAEQYTKGMSKLQTRQDRYIKSVQSAARHTKGYGNAMSANAVPATQEFSRVIQDLPYGVQGVANNIQQLTAQFGYLASKTGGAKQALKAMVGSLAGPAGILLAVSAITAALPFLIDAFKDSKDALKDTKDAVDDLTRAYDRYLQKSKDAQTLIDEQTRMQVALAKLNGASEDEINKITAQGVSKRVAAIGMEMQKREKLVERYVNSYNNLFAKGDEKSLELAEEYGLEINKLNRKNEEQRIEVQKLGNTIVLRDLATALSQKEELHKKSLENIKSIYKDAFKDTTNFGSFAPVSFEDAAAGGGGKGFLYGFQDMQAELEAMTPGWVEAFDTANDTIKDGVDEIAETLNKGSTQAGQFAQVLSKTMSDAFEGMGEYLGNMLSGQADGINLNGKKVLDAFGRFLGDLGKLAIAYGTFQLAMAIASSGPPNPVSAGIMIAAGIGMVAVGKAISNMNKQAPRASSGNYVGNSGGSTTGFATRSHTATPTSNNANVRFEIEGTTLVGVMNNTNNRNIALGGT